MPLSSADIGKELPEYRFSWSARDAILYALAVGAGPDELACLYEGAGPLVVPTFGVVPAFPALAGGIGTLDFDRRMTLHGAHRIQLHRPIPPAGAATTRSRIMHVWDKGADAVVVAEGVSTDDDGVPLFTNEFTAFVRGAGGFGGDRGPSTRDERPGREPDRLIELTTVPTQALLYRLCGDLNPLHVDTEVAAAAGFPRPILHGLCTFGFVGRALFSAFSDRDPERFRSMSARFLGVVFPGEHVTVRCWVAESSIRVVASVDDRESVVLDGHVVA